MNAVPSVQTSGWPSQPRSAAPSRPTDRMLAAVLEGKPLADEVPLAVWWFLAESLRHSVIVRRATEGVALLDLPVLRVELGRARRAAEAALEELECASSNPETLTDDRGVPPVAGRPSVRATTRDLARLFVTSRPTLKVRLRSAILDHLEALQCAVQ